MGHDLRMVSISQESTEETERRLRGVVAAAELVALPGEWSFHEAPLTEPPELGPEVLAVVRDEDCWSSLAPATATAAERFSLFSFHFSPGADNSGFVGWLATELKRRTGTGVFVVCGYNSGRGGIYDYWGCPVQVRGQVADALLALRHHP